MNITRLNYVQSLSLIRTAISQSHFLSFDLEMTGIANQQLLAPSIIDSMQLRYQKQKQSVNKYIPLQFGLSTFTVHPKLNKIVACPFNFYIFPLTLANQLMRFSFHAGTMNFLTKNNFDFNRLFYQGIPYTSQQQLSELNKKDKMMEYKRSIRKLKQLSWPQSKAFIAINLGKVQEWIKCGQNSALEIGLKYVKYQSYMNFIQKIKQVYPQLQLQVSFDSDIVHRRSKMIIKRGTRPQQINTRPQQINTRPQQINTRPQQINTRPQQINSQLLNCAVQQDGLFNQVVNLLADSKKPIIIHNGFLDLMHVYYRFYGSLPNKWHNYKEKLNTLFPYIYDNKYFFNQSPTLRSFTSNNLTNLQNCFVGMRQHSLKNPNSISIEIDQNFTEYKLDSLQCHEAGFDALMTGYSFLKGVTTLKNNIKTLTDPKLFAQQNKLLRNRVPQGSIKIPFNLQSDEHDIYTRDGNLPLYFKSVLNQIIEQKKIQEYFSKYYGPVNFLWSNFNMTEFYVIFLNSDDELKFINTLKQKTGLSSCVVTQIQGIKFLVLQNKDYQLYINNVIQNQEQEAVI